MASKLLQEAQDALDGLQPEVLRKATEALDIFKRGNDAFGTYDALRVIISYHRQVAAKENQKPLEALKLAEDQLAEFRRSGEHCGEGCMLLSLAEINMDRRGRKKREEALEGCRSALKIFEEAKAEKYEVMSQLILTNLYFKLDQPTKAQQASEKALAKAESFPLLHGKALHAAALALAAMGRYELAAGKAIEARGVFQQEGNRKMEAAQLVSAASWSLKASQPLKALRSAEEALQIFKQLGYGKGWQAKALGYVCEALVALNQGPKAAKLAKDFQSEFEKAEDRSSAARALQLQGFSWCGSETPERALEPLQAASEALPSEKGWRAGILQDQAASCLAGGDAAEAARKLGQAASAAREQQDARQEALALRKSFRLHFDRGDFQAATRAAEAARKVAQASGDLRGEARDLLRLASAASAASPGDAVAKALEAQEMCLAHEDSRGAAEALRLLCDLRQLEGNVDAALEAAEERLSLVRGLGDLLLEAEALFHVARLHLSDGSVADAQHVALQALSLAREQRSRALRVQLLLLLVEASSSPPESLHQTSQRKKLLRWSAEALALAGKVGDQSLRTLALYWRAYVWGILGRPSTGLSFAREARELCVKSQDKPSEARSWLMIGQLLFGEGSREEALEAARRSQELAMACGDMEAEVEVAKFMESMTKKEPPPAAAPPEAAATAAATPSPAAPEVSVSAVESASSLSPEEVGKQLIGFVKELTSGTEEVELDTAFIDAGMDSLSGVSLVSMLNRDFQTALTPSVVFDYPTIRMLQQYLIQESQG